MENIIIMSVYRMIKRCNIYNPKALGCKYVAWILNKATNLSRIFLQSVFEMNICDKNIYHIFCYIYKHANESSNLLQSFFLLREMIKYVDEKIFYFC